MLEPLLIGIITIALLVLTSPVLYIVVHFVCMLTLLVLALAVGLPVLAFVAVSAVCIWIAERFKKEKPCD